MTTQNSKPGDPKMTVEDFRYSVGNGNWEYFDRSGLTLDMIYAAVEEWKSALAGVTRPWLCWNVDSEWNVVQQRLVKEVGWTPVIGFDPRVGPPPVEPGAILIDFNEKLRLPTMWMHFPLEFIFLFCERLAFWHADFLARFEKMEHLAKLFAEIPDGATAVVEPSLSMRDRLLPHNRRYWEVVGCTTRGASKSFFDNGCGWWMSFAHHPSNSPAERTKRLRYYWDCGVGVRYWHKKCGGTVHIIPESYVAEGHFTGINKQDYQRKSPKNYRRNLSLELSLNFDLVESCRKLGIERLLAQ